MSRRDQEVVEDYKKIFSASFQTPHLDSLDGEWYLLEKKGRVRSIRIFVNGRDEKNTMSVFDYQQKDWTVTPLLIYKVDTSKVR